MMNTTIEAKAFGSFYARRVCYWIRRLRESLLFPSLDLV